MEKELESLGLSVNEVKVYLNLLDLGPSLAGSISKKTGLHRRSVYDLLDRLIEKGLVGYILQNNRKYFEVTNPERLLELMKEKEESIGKVLPELLKRYEFIKEKKETLFFRGKLGLKSVFEDQIREGKEILIFGASVEASEILKFYFNHYNKKRVEKKIKIKLIYDEDARNKVGKIPLSEVRFLKTKSFVATNIYADKVALILWSDEPFAILIKERKVADSYRRYFDLLWRIAKK